MIKDEMLADGGAKLAPGMITRHFKSLYSTNVNNLMYIIIFE
jgi:hypothetical protein